MESWSIKMIFAQIKETDKLWMLVPCAILLCRNFQSHAPDQGHPKHSRQQKLWSKISGMTSVSNYRWQLSLEESTDMRGGRKHLSGLRWLLKMRWSATKAMKRADIDVSKGSENHSLA